jgi:hypothetical protein
VRSQPFQRLGLGVVHGDGGGGGQRLGQDGEPVGFGQVRSQPSQRPGAEVVVGDGGGGGQRLSQDGGPVGFGRVRRRPSQRPLPGRRDRAPA